MSYPKKHCFFRDSILCDILLVIYQRPIVDASLIDDYRCDLATEDLPRP